MIKIAIDGGHGMNTAGKRTPDGEREWSFNNKVVLAAIAKLKAYKDVQVLRLDDPTGKRDVPLVERTNKANEWGADVLVSCHHNAYLSKWGGHGGVETITNDRSGANPKSVEIAKVVHPRVVKAMGLRNRGLKKQNLHMLRESRMPAILVEGGFMDSTTDIGSLRNQEKLKAQGEAIADGLAAYFNLTSGSVDQVSKPKPPTTPKPPVNKPSTNNATSIVDYLNGEGIDSSFANRKKLAAQQGIKNYTGTAAQNTALLNKLRSGSAPNKPQPKGDQKTTSLVAYLNSVQQDSSFTNRAKLAKQHSIPNYTGTAAQNTALLNKLRGGSAPSKPQAKGDQKTTSLVAYLNSIQQDSSFTNRAKLARQYGIKNYSGTAAQNTQLLKKLRG